MSYEAVYSCDRKGCKNHSRDRVGWYKIEIAECQSGSVLGRVGYLDVCSEECLKEIDLSICFKEGK